MSNKSDALIDELIVKAEQCVMGQCFASDVESARVELKAYVNKLNEQLKRVNEAMGKAEIF